MLLWLDFCDLLFNEALQHLVVIGIVAYSMMVVIVFVGIVLPVRGPHWKEAFIIVDPWLLQRSE